MFCMNCGSKLPEGSRFCFSCGISVNGSKATCQSINSVQLKCKNCDGVMNVDEDRPVLMCPFCGSKEILMEGDKVTIQRIKSKAYKDVEFGKQQIYKEVEFGKQQTYKEVELSKKEYELKGNSNKFWQILISFLIILVGAVTTYLAIWYVSVGGLLIGIIVIIAGSTSLKHSKGSRK